MHVSLRALFEPDGDNPPLIRSQRELARLLCERRRSGEQKVKTTAVFLNQIMLGRRPMPEGWRLDILAIVEQLGGERNISKERLTWLLASVENALGKKGLSALIAEQSLARDTLILNACPLELTDARNERVVSARLQSLVIEALVNERRYHYCVANGASARRLWNALFRFAAEKFGDTTKERVSEWIAKGLLTVSVVPELLLLHPTVVFNASVPDRLSVFVWHAPYDWENCLALPAQQTVTWLCKVQNVLDTQSQNIPFET